MLIMNISRYFASIYMYIYIRIFILSASQLS